MDPTRNEPIDNSYAARRARYRDWLMRKSLWGVAKILAAAVLFIIGLTANSVPLMFLMIPVILLISLAELLVERRTVKDWPSDSARKP